VARVRPDPSNRIRAVRGDATAAIDPTGARLAKANTTGPEREPFSLFWALVVSCALHLLLILISVWVPLKLSSAEEIDPLEETTIEFSFVEPSDTEMDEVARDLPPEPTPPQPSAVPDVVPTGQPDLDRSLEPDLLPPEPIQPPIPQAPEQPEPTPPLEQAEPEPEPEPAEVGGATDLPAEAEAEARREPDAASDRAATGPRLDLSQALQDFRHSRARRPSSSQPSSGSRGTPNNVFVPDFSALPTTGFGMGNLRFESTDFDWSDYGRQIYMAIWRAWHNRLYMTTNEFDKWAHQARSWYLNHSAAVRFVIERSGQVSGIAIEAESGCLPLDRSAIDALEEVLLPPLPAAFPRDREVVHARFITRGDVRMMKQVLAQYKQLGLF
jgi:outer membrane biosynthesis protein TonB